MTYNPKTDWNLEDKVLPEDMNRIEQGLLDAYTAVINHVTAEMHHTFVDGETTYRWGLAVIDGVVNMVYEEVV